MNNANITIGEEYIEDAFNEEVADFFEHLNLTLPEFDEFAAVIDLTVIEIVINAIDAGLEPDHVASLIKEDGIEETPFHPANGYAGVIYYAPAAASNL